MAGAVLSLFVILDKIPGGWEHIFAVAGAKFTVLDLRTDFLAPDFFSRTYSIWAGVIGGCFLTTASHGTEQLMVQRLLAARNEADSRKALLASWGVIFFQFSLFLLIGVLLFVYYQDAQLPPPNPPDRIYPAFVWNHLPVGVAGLITAAILAAAMSNLSAALNSLASTTIMDFVKPLSRRERTDAEWLALAKRSTVVWGAILFGIALIAQGVTSVLRRTVDRQRGVQRC